MIFVTCPTVALALALAPAALAQPCAPEYVGTTSGVASFDVEGDFILGTRPLIGMEIFDASDPDNLVLRSQLSLDAGRAIQADTDTALVQLDDTSIQLVEYTDPDNPTTAGVISVPYEIDTFNIAGDHAAVITEPASGGGSVSPLFIFDISDINNPVQLVETTASRYTHSVEMSPSAIVTRSTNGVDLQVHDLTGTVQSAPSATIPGYVIGVLQGNTLAAGEEDAIAFYDLSNPSSPLQLSWIDQYLYSDGFTSLEEFVFVGDYIYTTFTENKSDVWVARVFDAGDIQNLPLLHSTSGSTSLRRELHLSQLRPLAGQIISLGVVGGIHLFDEFDQNFTSSRCIQAARAWGRTFEHNGYVYGSSHGTLRIGTPASLEDLQAVAEIEVEPGILASIDILGFIGNTAVIASPEESGPRDTYITAVDASNPLQPVITDRIRFASGFVGGLILIGSHVYVADRGEEMLRAVEILPSGQFSVLTETSLPVDSSSLRMKHSDGRLYIGSPGFSWEHDFRVFDLADPLNPALLYEIDHNNANLDGNFEVVGDLVYFKRVFRDFAILDLTNPADPVITVDFQLLPSNAQLIGSANHTLYIRQNGVGMTVINVSHPGVYPTYGPFILESTLGPQAGGIVDFPYIDVLTSFGDNTRYDISSCMPQPCPADLTDDGLLNFFDVSAFLNAFTAQQPAADFTGDGMHDYFDVSAFLNSFSAGCP